MRIAAPVPDHMVTDILKDLIRIDTRTSAGNETEAAVYLKSWCDRFEIENEIVEDVKGKGSFIAHIPGRDKSKRDLLLLSHLDTAEFGDLNKWRFHPLSAEEYKGRIVGRGAIDCKGLTSVWLSILIDLRKSNRRPERGITFAAAADEENGGQYGMAVLIGHNDRIKRSEYVIGEGGGFPLKLGDTIYYTCQNAEKGTAEYRILGNPIVNLASGLFRRKIYNAELIKFLFKQACMKPSGRRIDVKDMLCDSYRIDMGHTGLDTELYRTIVSQTSKLSAEYRVIPYTTPGYSDNRFLREQGKKVYGFFPLSLEDSLAGIHGYNESIGIESLAHANELLKDIIWKFCSL